ncbi:hypothetical protein ACO2Q9_10395 [Variovorax sp. VNK109]|uniref:hypothetical protein n=1 Tax=Variovorax sp. VNK109 TaxID=3400919 RepID=UPI003C0DE5ED
MNSEDSALTPASSPAETPPQAPARFTHPKARLAFMLSVAGVVGHSFITLAFLAFAGASSSDESLMAFGIFVGVTAFLFLGYMLAVMFCLQTSRRRLAIWIAWSPMPVLFVLGVLVQALIS